jgi:exopolyphosphatase/guanosine-5'-triphosphate,3'-diphosphate pyrophosphatase
MRAAVIDIGSNSIKLLVAERAPDGSPLEVASRTLEVRISDGIGSGQPRLGAGPMDRGAAAVAELAAEARRAGATRIAAVATSAVRDASNGRDFLDRVRIAAAVEARILSGEEEAALIGRGLATDPGLRRLADFDVFDLGGGSLECLCFRGRAILRAVSLPLGCVRLTERFGPAAGRPLGADAARRVAAHVRDCLAASGFPLPVQAGIGVVGTGGTLTTVRAIGAAARSLSLAEADPRIGVGELRALLALLSPMDVAQRRAIPGLSAARADVFPVALATLVALAEAGGFASYLHSLRNLRWGVAAQMLEGP